MSGRAGKSHHSSRSLSTVWLTPRPLLEALGPFDLDPCAAPEPRPFPTAANMIALPEDGLAADWGSSDVRVWLNAPWGTRPLNLWIPRLAAHGRGIALVPVATETEYWKVAIWPFAYGIRFTGPRRLKFLLPSGEPARGNCGTATALVAYGPEDAEVLASCGVPGNFAALRLDRFYLVEALTGSWRSELLAWIHRQRGPVALSDLYRAFERHPKARGRQFYREKIRQTLKRGPFRRVEEGWAAA